MSNMTRTWLAGGVVAAVLAAGVARAEEPGAATWVMQQDVAGSQKVSPGRTEKAEAGKATGAEAAKPAAVDEGGRVIRAKYSAPREGEGQQK
jgi:hypothetical protein